MSIYTILNLTGAICLSTIFFRYKYKCIIYSMVLQNFGGMTPVSMWLPRWTLLSKVCVGSQQKPLNGPMIQGTSCWSLIKNPFWPIFCCSCFQSRLTRKKNKKLPHLYLNNNNISASWRCPSQKKKKKRFNAFDIELIKYNIWFSNPKKKKKTDDMNRSEIVRT